MTFLVEGWLIGLVLLSLGTAALLSIIFAAASVSRQKPSDILRGRE
jgi:hypothetical protein